ncbi:MAG: pentapeptide repeat-containing protein [Phycisphaerales bacterium JB041]
MSRPARGGVRPPDLPERLEPFDPVRAPTPREISERSIEDATLSGAPRERLSITSSRARAARFAGASVENLTDTVLEHCDLANAEWSNARLRRAEFRECRGTGLGLGGATLTDVAFIGCKLNLACFIGASLTQVRFEGCDLREADFDSAGLESVVFRRCELGGARLVRSSLARVDLRGSRLGAIVLSPEMVRGCTIDEAQAVTFAASLGLRVEPIDDSSNGF